MASADRTWSRLPNLVVGAGFVVLLAACSDGSNPESTEILKSVVQATRVPQKVTTIVIDGDLSGIPAASSPLLPPVRRGASDLERTTTSLKPGELAIVGFHQDGDEARVKTRSVTAATHRPGSALDCGTAQTFVLRRGPQGDWTVVEIQGLNC